MSDATDQLTQRPLCPICKTNELTNEELTMRTLNRTKGACWFCVVNSLVQMQMEVNIPDPTKYGRPEASIEEQIAITRQKHARPPIDATAVETGSTPAPGHVAPILTGQSMGAQLRFTDQERKDFSLGHGFDPAPKVKPTEVIVHGATDDTYMKFSIPLPIDVKDEVEIKRIMQGMLEIFGKLLKYGPQFAGTLLELQAMGPEMFLGNRK